MVQTFGPRQGRDGLRDSGTGRLKGGVHPAGDQLTNTRYDILLRRVEDGAGTETAGEPLVGPGSDYGRHRIVEGSSPAQVG
jgi:hypothetical protein